MDPLSESMNKSLALFTDSLIPTDEFLAAGTKQVEMVMRTLAANSKFSIARYRYAGSVGKHTEIMCPDYDVVVFLNGVRPPFDRVLEDFEDVLILSEDRLKVDTSSFKKTDIGLQFQFRESQVEMDLMIGINCLGRGEGVGGRALVERQREGVLPLLDARNFRMYSGSLSELQMEFVKQRSGFTHQVIRLGKFWFKTLYLGAKPIYGIKTILEIIAVFVSEKEEEERPERVLLRTFMKFLELVSKLDKLKIAYRYDPARHRWELVPVQEREVGYRYDSSGFPPGTLAQDNFILEPANPYNNLTKNFRNREEELENLKKFAKITMDRFRSVARDSRLTIYDVFRPLPTALKVAVFNQTPKIQSGGILSSYAEQSVLNPRMIVRQEGIFKIPGMRNELRALQGFLYTAVHAAAASLEQKGEAVEAGSVKRAVQRMIDEDITGTGPTSWTSSTDKHENYDVTFDVPLATKPEVGVFRTSFKWERN